MRGKNPVKLVADSYEGISSGLKFWLFFLVGFYFAGYSAEMSIFLGAIGGIAGGFMVAWWQAKEEPKTQEQVEDLEQTSPYLSRATIRKLPRTKSRRYRRGSVPWWRVWPTRRR